ncbi:MAG: hypothetical protein ACRCTJ_00770 [Brevinema sp.]
MLTPNTMIKLKKLEIDLEISLRDELSTEKIIEKALEKTLEMSSQEIIDDSEQREILRVLRSIIQEEDMFAKMMLGNCVKMLDQINDFAKRMELLR